MTHPELNFEITGPNGGRKIRRRGFRIGIAIFTVLTFGAIFASAQGGREYQLKAVFLYNFAQFTEWPTDAFATAQSPIVIGVLGNDPFGPILDEVLRGETIGGRPLVAAHYRSVQDIKRCDILFISQSETRRMDEIVNSLKGKPILTVTDAQGPSTDGVIIRFIIENNKLHFRINLEAAKTAHLELSSRLLRLADWPGRRGTP